MTDAPTAIAGGQVNLTNNVWAKSVNGTYQPVNSNEAFFAWDRDGAYAPYTCGNGASCVVNIIRNVIYYSAGIDGPLFAAGRNRYGVQGAHLNPLGLFLCTSTPCMWRILSACLPAWTPRLRGPVSPRFAEPTSGRATLALDVNQLFYHHPVYCIGDSLLKI
jgi:hypothetical protein